MNWFGKLFPEVPLVQTPAYEKDIVIIDVRTPGEFASGHVEDALNLPLKLLGQKYATLIPDRAKQIVAYGETVSRSAVATQFLKLQRYVNVINGKSASDVARNFNRKIV
jgi:phage shock protein E